jgi:hypothetical protein
MRTQTQRHHPAADAILTAWEADADLDAWTLDELAEDLGPYPREPGSPRPAFAGSDDAGG